MSYVDGFLLPVPTRNLAAYKKMAKVAGKVWKDHGALHYYECAADDLKNAMGITFDGVLKPKKGETVIFSFIVYKTKADRKRVMKAVMADPRLKGDINTMPFDFKRMAYGGFKTLVESHG